MEYANSKKLFSPPWDLQEWAASDDRVRGGHSTSCLSRTPHGVLFHGNLDIKALGGAGFASQKTVSTEKSWDLSDYDGLELDVQACDSKRYTVSVTDEIPEHRSDGREQSALIWEADFCPEHIDKVFRVKWSELRPTYRGKEVPVARPLDLSRVRRFRIMIRRYVRYERRQECARLMDVVSSARKRARFSWKCVLSRCFGHYIKMRRIRRTSTRKAGLRRKKKRVCYVDGVESCNIIIPSPRNNIGMITLCAY